MKIFLVVLALAAAQLEDVCEDGDCALSLRQLRGQQFEAKVWEHGEMHDEMEDTPATQREGSEDVYSKAPDAATATAAGATPAAPANSTAVAAAPVAPAAAEAPGSEVTPDPYSKPDESTPATAATAPATPATPAVATTAAPATTAAAATTTEDEWGNMTQEAWEEKQGGLCCFTGEDFHDTCGSCYPTAIASFKSTCSKGADQCMNCGGSWCQPKCVMGAADPNNKCKTAFATGIAESKSFCGSNAKGCASCKGEWCRLGVSKLAGGSGVAGGKTEEAANIEKSSQGFCCYRGDPFTKDMCGACLDVSQDIACATAKGCGTCGGTWCAGPKCVKASRDKKDPCGTAYPDSVARAGDFCGGSERRCQDCAGAWCSSSNITFTSGEKYDPAAEPEEAEESEESEESESDEEATEEPEKDEAIHELFPGFPA